MTGTRPLPLVSVVTPFFNTAPYLAECIESVLAQDYDNFEYILADNCSTDDSLAIARQYAERDPRIRVVSHTDFIDQDANYNRALSYISPSSRYVKIAQADDTLMRHCLMELVALAEVHPSAGIVSCCFLTGDALAGHGLPFDRNFFSGREACRTRLLTGGTYFGSPTCLLYRADIVRARPSFFGANESNADTTACFEILSSSDFARVPQILCRLRRGNPSVSDALRRHGAASFLNYALVERFGPVFLDEAELVKRRKMLRDIYLRLLARAVPVRNNGPFWQFHREALATLGQSLPRVAIGWRFLDYVLQKILNPRQSIELAVQALRESESEKRSIG
ncbi:MAG: glycosyltransferase family A protein [Gammaproteobacteria bacterium]